MGPRKVIHCIGDSHTSFFTGYNKIQPEYPQAESGLISNVVTYRIGAPLAYNLIEKNSKSNSNQKLFEIVGRLDPKEDILLLSFGEIDCRAHLLKQAAIQNINVDKLLVECIDRYVEVIHQLKSLGFTVCVWNAVPTAMGFDETTLEYPYYGSFVERNQLTSKFNKKLLECQVKYEFQYYGVFNKLVGPDWKTNEKYYFDKIHLNNTMLPDVLFQIKSKNEIGFSRLEILKLHTRILLDNRILGKNKWVDSLFGLAGKIASKIKNSLK